MEKDSGTLNEKSGIYGNWWGQTNWLRRLSKDIADIEGRKHGANSY